jgi:hypothetical protein
MRARYRHAAPSTTLLRLKAFHPVGDRGSTYKMQISGTSATNMTGTAQPGQLVVQILTQNMTGTSAISRSWDCTARPTSAYTTCQNTAGTRATRAIWDCTATPALSDQQLFTQLVQNDWVMCHQNNLGLHCHASPDWDEYHTISKQT